MNTLDLAREAVAALEPHLVAVALISARLVPAAFLCPVFGGPQAPTTVKLTVVLALAASIHAAGGVGVGSLPRTAFAFGGLAAQETLVGTIIGLVAALPFDTARMGGRFTDLFRGSSAEAALPFSGTRETATGDLLHQLLVAVVAVGGAGPFVVSALYRTFAVAPLGGFTPTEGVALEIGRLVGAAFATGLAVGAPIAALSLAIDLVLGLAARAAPQANLNEVAAPARLLAGGAVVWLTLGSVAQRLLDVAGSTPEDLARVLELGR